MAPTDSDPPGPNLKPTPSPADLVDATRRTFLAGERTQMAWWRTGLAALAVAIGVGRVVPGLEGNVTRWPYVVTGVAFRHLGDRRDRLRQLPARADGPGAGRRALPAPAGVGCGRWPSAPAGWACSPRP